MSILDEIEAEEVASNRTSCKTCTWLGTRPDAERADWETALSDFTRDAALLHRVMTRHGFAGSAYSVRNHRAEHIER